MNSFSIYDDIATRTSGEIYMAVVGPVRTGKSTFVRNFIEQFLLPKVSDVQLDEIVDQLPLSGSGTTITTVEPKFIPKKAVEICVSPDDDTKHMKLKLIDCVGYMVEGANGHLVDGTIRMVKTPWQEEEIPFTKAAGIGTRKVIYDHSTLAVVVTTDGSISDIPRDAYVEPEQETICQLKELGKPFVVVLNCVKPYSQDAKMLADRLSCEYQIPVIPMNLEQLKDDDINKIFEQLIGMFPITEIRFQVPEYVYMLDENAEERVELFSRIKDITSGLKYMKDVSNVISELAGGIISEINLLCSDMESGSVSVRIELKEECYYNFISSLLGVKIKDDFEYFATVKELAEKNNQLKRLQGAWEQACSSGFGVVLPERNEVVLHKPEIIKQGNKFGVKIKACAPCTHFIKTEIDTELAPVVGSQNQAEDLYEFICQNQNSEGLWNTNIFGKSMGQMVEEGISSKIASLNDESRQKLQESMSKIVNESCGLVCFII